MSKVIKHTGNLFDIINRAPPTTLIFIVSALGFIAIIILSLKIEC